MYIKIPRKEGGVKMIKHEKTMSQDWFFRRGDIYLANLSAELNNHHGSIQGGIRPVIVVSNNMANHFSPLLSIVPVTSEIKKVGQPTYYILRHTKRLDKMSMAVAEQTTQLNKTNVIRYIGKLSAKDMEGIEEALRIHYHLQP